MSNLNLIYTAPTKAITFNEALSELSINPVIQALDKAN